MPYDGNYINSVISAQQSAFIQNNAYTSSLAAYSQPGMSGGMPSIPSAQPMPPAPSPVGAIWQSGMNVAPNQVNPYYTTSWGMARGLAGMTPDSGYFSPIEAQRAAQTQAAGMWRGAKMGALEAMPGAAGTVAGYMGFSAGYALSAPFLGPVGGMAVGMGAEHLVSNATQAVLDPLADPARNFRQGRQLRSMAAGTIGLRQYGFSQNQMEEFVGRQRDMFRGLKTSGSITGSIESRMNENFQILGDLGNAGMFTSANSSDQAIRMMEEAPKMVRKIAKLLKVSIQEGTKLMTDLQQMGFYDLQSMTSQMESTRMFANMAGVGVESMMQTAAGGAALLGPGGATAAMTMHGRLSQFMGTGKTATAVRRMGGAQQAALGALTESSGFIQSSGLGLMMMANQITGGSGGAFNIAGVHGGQIGRMSISQMATLFTPEGQQEQIAKLGAEGGPAVVESLRALARRAGVSGEDLNDPRTLAFFARSAGSPISADALQVMMAQSDPNVLINQAVAKDRGSIRSKMPEYSDMTRYQKMRYGNMGYGAQGLLNPDEWATASSSGLKVAGAALMAPARAANWMSGGALGALASPIAKAHGAVGSLLGIGARGYRNIKEDFWGTRSTAEAQAGGITASTPDDIRELIEYTRGKSAAQLGREAAEAEGRVGSAVGGQTSEADLVTRDEDVRKAIAVYMRDKTPANLRKVKNLLLTKGTLGKGEEELKRVQALMQTITTDTRFQEAFKTLSSAKEGISFMQSQGVMNVSVKAATKLGLGGGMDSALNAYGAAPTAEAYSAIVSEAQRLSDKQLSALEGSGAVGKSVVHTLKSGKGSAEGYNTLMKSLKGNLGTSESEKTTVDTQNVEASNVTINAAGTLTINTVDKTKIKKTEPGKK